MDVTVVSRSDEARRGHRQLAEELSERLPRYFQGIVFIEWTLDADGHRHDKVVHINLHASHNFYRVTSSADTFSHAMHVALEKLIEQRRRKKRQRTHRRRINTPVSSNTTAA
jgi:ribosome-associated translation inhibitor RaiA